MGGKFPSQTVAVSELLGGDQVFEIPGFQRPYSWTAKEAGLLLDDILEAASPEAPEFAKPDYFLGAVILLDTRLDAGSAVTTDPLEQDLKPQQQRIGIVDGQQRIVTLTIIVAALRDGITDGAPSPEFIADVDRLLNVTHDTRRSHRVRMAGAAQQFFLDHVLTPGACSRMPDNAAVLTPDLKTLLDVREYILNQTSELTPEERLHLVRFIGENCHLVTITASELDSAHVMFKRINDRGKSLEREDLIKAEIFRAATGDSKTEAAVQAWEDARAQLRQSDFNWLFGFIASAHGRTGEKIIADIRRTMATEGSVEAFVLNTLAPFANGLAEIRRAQANEGLLPVPVRRLLVSLGRLAGREFYPAALAALVRFGPNSPETERLIHGIERLAYISRLRGGKPRERTAKFNRIATQINAGADADALAEAFDVRGDMRTVAHHLKDVGKREARMCKPLLLKINDMMVSDDEFIAVSASKYSVEHVLPQTPKPKSAWRVSFADAEQRQQLTVSLGNMVLVSSKLNGALANNDFSDKQVILRSALTENGAKAGAAGPSVLPVTRAALTHTSWGPDVVVAREAEMLEILSKTWRVEIPGRRR